MASFNEVSAGSYVNVSAIVGANVRNVSRNGTSVYFEYQAYIYQSTPTWSSNSWALWVEGSKNIVFNSNSGANHTSQGSKYYTVWYGRSISLGTGTSSTTVSIGVNGNRYNPTSPAGYVTLTLSGLPTVGKPSLSSISVSSIGDKSVYASFSVTNNNYQDPYSPHIDVATSNFSGVVSTINARAGTLSGLDPNRTYYVRGNDANDAGQTYTNVASFTTIYNNPGAPGAPILSYNQTEPIPKANLKATWTAASAGSTAISGYRLILYKNGTEIKVIDTESTDTFYTFGTFESLGFVPGDIAKVGIYSYAKDWAGNKHFNGDGASSAQVYSSNTITEVSDKYIYVSSNGSSFNKYKMYVSVDNGAFNEVKKEKFKVI